MILSTRLRGEIADQIIRIVAPVIFFGLILILVSFPVLGGQQYQRLIPTVVCICLVMPAWVFARRGKPLTGMLFLIACYGIGLIISMIVSGGIHALAYPSTLILITIFVILYGKRGGIIFAILAVTIGILFSLLIHHGILHRVDEPPTYYLLLIHTIYLIAQLFFVWVPVRLMYKALLDGQHQRTELQQAVIERKKAQDELQSILNKTPDIIYRLDPEGKITFINEAVRKYGRRPEELLGRSILEFVHPEDRAAAHQALFERRSGNPGAKEIEIRLSLLDATAERPWQLFHVSGDALYSEDTVSSKSYAGTQGIARDISMIRHFEQQVDRLAVVVEQAAEDVVITDQDGVIQYVNPRFETVTGYQLSEVVGQTPRILKSGKHQDAFYADLWKTIKSGKIWKGHIWNKIKNGSLILQDVTITPIFGAARKLTGYASVRRDITEQHRLQEQLQHSQKMEAIGTLAGGIAHDFNNILSGIIGYAELALNDVKEMPSTKEMLARLLEAASRATNLVKQILSFSRSQKSEVKPINPASITKEVLKLLRATLPSTIEIKQSIQSGSYILADATNFHQVLMNLCTNAAQAMKQKGGVLSVSLQDVFLSRDNLTHRPDVLPGGYLKIAVEDTGTGMTTEVKKKAFDPFFTTKELGEGTGMGLATVHGIVIELSGFISLYSEPGQGTVVQVFLPLIPKPAEIGNQPAQAPLQGGTERILYVDDEQTLVELAKSALKRYGYRVTGFSDSMAALAHFQQDPDAYDLVVTDMTMPKLTGDILTQKIHMKRPDIPIIMSSGFSEVIDERKAQALGIDAFLSKPVIMETLLKTIRKVLGQKR
jgi:PAS domain S-box-containing protein